MDTKVCKTCHMKLPLGSFYARAAKCKECTKAAVKANRLSKLEYYREYDRLRGRTEERKRLVRERQKQEGNWQKHLENTKKWADKNSVKRKCQYAVSNAIRDGKLEKLPCWICGNPDVEAHHPYYDLNFPLDVVWLCVDHHKEVHRKY